MKVNQAQLNLLRMMARSGLASDRDVGLGANVLLALLDDIEYLQGDLEATKRVLAAERDIVPAYAVLHGAARLLIEALDVNDWSEPGISDELYSAREAVRSELNG